MSKKSCKPVKTVGLWEAVQKMKTSGQPKIVQFFATWCAACQAAKPAVDKAACALEDSIETIRVDVDQHPELAAEYGVENLPTVMVVKDGIKQAEMVGATTAAKYQEMGMQWLKDNGYKG